MSSDEEGEGKETALSTAASLLKVSRLSFIVASVADPVCLSWILIFFPSGSNNKKEKESGKNFSVLPVPFFIAIFTKLENNFILN
jgi:hypothetical protein